MAENKIILEVDAKLDKLDKKLDTATSTMEKKFGEAGKLISDELLGDFGSTLIKIATIGGPVLVAILAIKEAISSAFDGETIKAAAIQFDILAKNAGLAGEALKGSLIATSRGLIDDTQILKEANKGIIEFGGNAARLPEIMSLATRVTQIFGGTAVANFEGLSQAIAGGNVRALRQFGIIIDADEALKKYAKSIGTTASALNEYGRQNAIMNAVMEKSRNAYKGLSADTLQLNNDWNKLKANVNSLADSFKVSVNSSLGPLLTWIVQSTSSAAKNLSNIINANFGTGSDKTKGEIAGLELELQKLGKRLFEVRKEGVTWGGSFKTPDALKAETDMLNAKMMDRINLIKKLRAEISGAQSNEAKDKKPKETIDDVTATNQANVRALFLKTDQDVLASRLERARAIGAIDQEEALQDQQKALLLRQREEEKSRIKREYLNKNLISQQEFAERSAQLDEEYKNKSILLETRRLALVKSINEAVQAAITNAIVDSIKNMVTNLMKGENAFKNFGKVLLGLLGGLAIQIGTMIIAAGVAKLTLIEDLGGGATIVAGAALVAVGAALEAFASGGGETGGGVASASAGGSASPNGLGGGGFATDASATNVDPQKTTNFHLNFHGPVLDKKESGLAILDYIKEAAEQTGAKVVIGGGF